MENAIYYSKKESNVHGVEIKMLIRDCEVIIHHRILPQVEAQYRLTSESIYNGTWSNYFESLMDAMEWSLSLKCSIDDMKQYSRVLFN